MVVKGKKGGNPSRKGTRAPPMKNAPPRAISKDLREFKTKKSEGGSEYDPNRRESGSTEKRETGQAAKFGISNMTTGRWTQKYHGHVEKRQQTFKGKK